MNSELLNNIKNLTLESLIIAIVVFILTMLVKIPIKNKTSKLEESKRKAINSVIIIIPIILSLLLSISYYGLFKSQWFSLYVLETAISSWILSFTMYTIYQRIYIIIKGILSGKLKINSDLTKETISLLKNEIKTISSKLKTDEKSLSKLENKKSSLINIKEMLDGISCNIDIAKISETNFKLKTIQIEETVLKNQIETNKQLLENYNQKLYIQGENV